MQPLRAKGIRTTGIIEKGKGEITYTTTISTHHINRQPAAVLRPTLALTVPRAENLPHAPRELLNNGASAVHRDLLARGVDSRQRRLLVAAEARVAGRAALHLGRAGALAGDGLAGAVALPAAVAGVAVGARGLGAALDVGGVARAGTRNRGAAVVGAGGARDADACRCG